MDIIYAIGIIGSISSGCNYIFFVFYIKFNLVVLYWNTNNNDATFTKFLKRFGLWISPDFRWRYLLPGHGVASSLKMSLENRNSNDEQLDPTELLIICIFFGIVVISVLIFVSLKCLNAFYVRKENIERSYFLIDGMYNAS